MYNWLNNVKSPKILHEAIKLLGTKEVIGEEHNPIIISWAKEIGGWIGHFYNNDEIPWCGLFVGICAKRARFPFNQKMLSAREWLKWGVPQQEAMLGDVLVFSRKGGGHVGFYVGEDEKYYHVLGGNQNNSVNVVRISKERLLGVRRCKWRLWQPRAVKKVFLDSKGFISVNEL